MNADFGYKKPQGEVACYWGARAIYRDFQIDLVPDRQSCVGSDPKAKEALISWLNRRGLSELRKQVQKSRLRGNESREVHFEDAGFYIEACPNASYGYLYIGAGLTQETVNG